MTPQRLQQNSKLLLIVILVLTSFNSALSNNSDKNVVYRISCGSNEAYIDDNGAIWAADQGFSESKTVTRESTLTIHNTTSPEVYRTERYNLESYNLPVEFGTYTIHLHFAQTFDSNYRAGSNFFGVSVNGKTVLKEFDPYTAAGGFALPVIIEYAGFSATDKIVIEFTENAVINGIEVFKTASETPETILRITPVAGIDEFFVGKRKGTIQDAQRLKILFIGNSMTFFWAIPESLEAMLETGTDNLRIDAHRSLYGGKSLEYHYNKTNAVDMIKNGGYDLVVLQEGTLQCLNDHDLVLEYGEKFNKIIRESGAITLFYPSLLPQKYTDADRRKVMQLFVELSKKTAAKLIPACETIRLCYAERPEIIWHNADRDHMGMHGGYAVACTFYAALTGGAPFPPPAILAQQVKIDPEIALFIQEKAIQAVDNYYRK